MTIEMLTAPRKGLLGSPPAGLKLRLTRRGHKGRIVNVRGSKCTIGASANCTLRIDGPKVDPLACLVVRGAARTLVRGYSGKVQLNGKPCGDALLKPGDQLQIGSYKIEILPDDLDLGQELARTRDDIAHLRNGLADIQRLLNVERAEFHERDEQWRARLAASELEGSKYAETLAALLHLQAEFAEVQRVLVDERAAFQEREEQLRAHLDERDEVAANYSETLNILARLEGELATARRDHEEECARWKQGQQDLEAHFAERLSQHEREAAQHTEALVTLTQLQIDFAEAERLLAEERSTWETQRQQLKSRVVEQEARAAKNAETAEALKQAQNDLAALQALRAKDREDAQTQQTQFRERLIDNESRLIDADSQIEQLQLAVSEAQRALETERATSLQRDEDWRASAKAALEQLQAEFDAVQQNLTDERAAFHKREEHLRTHLAEGEEVAAKYAETRDALACLENELAAVRRDYDEQRAVWKQGREEVESQLLQRLAEQEQEAAEHATTLADLTQLQTDFAASEQMLAQERRAWESERQQLEGRLADAQAVRSDLARSSEEAGHLRRALSDLQQTLDVERAKSEQQRQQCEALESEHAQAVESIAQLERELAAAQAAHEQERVGAEARYNELDVQRFEAENRLHEANIERGEWKQRQQEFEVLQSEHAKAVEAIARLQHQLAAAQAHGEQDRADAESRQIELSTQLVEADARLLEANHQVEQLRNAVNLAQGELEDERTEFRRREDDLQARLAEWLVYLHGAQNAAVQHTQTTETLTRVQSELAAIEADRTRERADAGARRDELDAQLVESERRLVEASQEAEQLRQALGEAQRALDEQQIASREHRERLEARLAEREAQWQSSLADDEAAAKRDAELLERLEKLQADVDSTQRARTQEQSEWQSQREQFVARLDERESAIANLTEAAHEIARLQNALAESQLEVGELRTSLSAQPESADSGRLSDDDRPSCQPEAVGRLLDQFSHDDQADVAFETPSASAPVSTAALLNQFGFSVDEDQTHAVQPASRASEESDGLAEGDDSFDGDSSPDDVEVIDDQRPARTQASDEDEESIDDYMNQLMARLGKPSYTPTSSDDGLQPDGAASPAKPHARKTDASTAAVRKLRDTSEMVRRTQAPERSSDLSALREVANLNARTALDTHSRSTLSRPWLAKALVALAALVSAVVNGWIGLDGNAVAVYLAIVSLGAAGYFGSMCLTTARSIVATRGQTGTTADEAAKP